MPDLQAIETVEHEQEKGHQASTGVGPDENPAPVEAIHQDTGKWAGQHGGAEGEKSQQRDRCRLAGLLIEP